MYERIKAYRRPRGNGPLWLGLLACLLIIAVVIGLIAWAYWYQMRFRAFVRDLSDSTVYAYEHDCLRAEVDGQSVQVSAEYAYAIYADISTAGPGRIDTAPDEAPAAVLDYGDGSRMEVWSVKLVNSSTDLEYGLFVRYTDREGGTYAYDTDQLPLEAVMRYLR